MSGKDRDRADATDIPSLRYQHPVRTGRVAAGAGGLHCQGLGAAAAGGPRPCAGADLPGLAVPRVSQVAPGQGGAQHKCYHVRGFIGQTVKKTISVELTRKCRAG